MICRSGLPSPAPLRLLYKPQLSPCRAGCAPRGRGQARPPGTAGAGVSGAPGRGVRRLLGGLWLPKEPRGSEKNPDVLGTQAPGTASPPAQASRRAPRRPGGAGGCSLLPPAPGASQAVLDIFLLKGQVPGASSQSNCEIIMVGDFNLNWMEKCCTAADSFAMDFHLTKLISQPTRLNLKVVIIHY